MEVGYVGLFRKITQSWIFDDPIILKVFIYFLCEASTKCEKVDVNGQTVALITGQLVSGRKHLMDNLNLTERLARKALDVLKNNKVIELKTSSTYNVITVLKYNEYQSIVKKTAAKDVQHLESVEEVLVTKPDRTLDFDIFWKAYPKKQAKFTATKSWKKLNPNKSLVSEIMKGLSNWKASEQWTKDGGKFIPMPSTWLNQHRWEDEFDEPKTISHSNVGELPTEL